jgi:flagellar biosynthesis protein FliQ
MPYDETAIHLAQETLLITLKIAAPILVAGVLVGLLISLLQSVTSIQDQTLTFVPKIVVMLTVAALLLPWIAIRLVEYASQLFWLISG